MRRRSVLALLAAVVALSARRRAAPGRERAAKDELVIGITQFLSTLHPNIDSMAAKSYVLGMAQRPFTAYDPKWQLICMLCTELPTIENGLAKIEQQDDGRDGIALTYTIRPEATWGDGTPVTTDDVLFTYQVGSHPRRREQRRAVPADHRIDVIDDKTFVMHLDRVEFEYNAINDFRPLPAHLERPVFEADRVPQAHDVRHRAGQPGAVLRAVSDHRGLERRLHRARAEPDLVGRAAAVPAHRGQGDREHRRRSKANLLSGSIDMIAGELGLTIDQALAFEKRHGDPVPDRVRAGPDLRAHRSQPRQSDPGGVRVRKALIMGSIGRR